MYLHCKLAHAGVWKPLFAYLPERPSTAELPGHGHAPDWDQTRDYHSQALELAIEAMDGPADVVGHSFGGTVALRLAIERPDLVRSLVLIEPVLFAMLPLVDPAMSERRRADNIPFRQAMDAKDYPKAARMFSASWGEGAWDAMPPKRQDYIIDRMPLIAAGAPAIEADTAGLIPRLGQITAPVLLMQGSQSDETIPAIIGGLCDHIPNARRITIQSAGHMAPITHPKPVAEAILAFQQGDKAINVIV